MRCFIWETLAPIADICCRNWVAAKYYSLGLPCTANARSSSLIIYVYQLQNMDNMRYIYTVYLL